MAYIVVATQNEHKVDEYRELLKDQGVELRSLRDYPNFPDVEENGKTLYLQAVIAARTNDVEKSLKHLAKAIKKDHKIKNMAKNDMEFAYMQDSPEFIALVE